jgi:hypothetical protein
LASIIGITGCHSDVLDGSQRQQVYTGENRPIRAKENGNRNLMLLSKQFFELGNVFSKKIDRNLIYVFLLNKTGSTFKTH